MFFYLVTNAAKDSESPELIAFRCRRIVKAPMNLFCLTRKNRTLFASIVTNRDHVIKFLIDKLINRLRAVLGNINADIAHRRNRLGSNTTRRHAGTCYIKHFPRHLAQQTFRHLATCRVSGAKKQNPLSLTHVDFLPYDSRESNHRNNAVAAAAPPIWAMIKAGASTGLIPAKVSVTERASVTAGFAKDVEAVNQYAATMYAATANATTDGLNRLLPKITASKPKVATASLKIWELPFRTCCEAETSGNPNII